MRSYFAFASSSTSLERRGGPFGLGLRTTEVAVSRPDSGGGGPKRDLVFARIAHQFRWVARAETSMAAFANTFGSRVAFFVVNLATGVLVARTLAPAGRGEQAAIVLWPGLLCGLATLGVPVALRYQLRRTPERERELFSTALVLALVLGTIAAAVGALAVPHWLGGHRYPPQVGRYAQLAMLFAIPLMISYTLQAFLEGSGAFNRANAMYVLPALATLAILGALLVLHRLTPYTSALAYLIPPVTLPLFWQWRARAYVRFPIGNFLPAARDLLSYGTRAYGIDVLVKLTYQIDQTLVIRFLAAGELGIYVVALNIARSLNVVASSLFIVLFPKASGLEHEAAIELVERAARVTLAIALVAAACIALVLPAILPLLYGQAFVRSVRVAQVLLLDTALLDSGAILAQAFLSTGRPGVVTVTQAAALATAVPLLVVLVPRLGVLGAALALFASTICRLAFLLGCYPIVLRRPPPRLILTRNDIRFVLDRIGARAEKPA
jgi:O-antigen/teichoic acid export membrane protein